MLYCTVKNLSKTYFHDYPVNVINYYMKSNNMTTNRLSKKFSKTAFLNILKYTAQQKFSMDFFFVLILVRIRNNFFEVINKYGNP